MGGNVRFTTVRLKPLSDEQDILVFLTEILSFLIGVSLYLSDLRIYVAKTMKKFNTFQVRKQQYQFSHSY